MGNDTRLWKLWRLYICCRFRVARDTDERGARAVDPKQVHARHGKRAAPHVQLAQAQCEGGRRGEAGLEGAHLRGEERQAGVLELMREGQARPEWYRVHFQEWFWIAKRESEPRPDSCLTVHVIGTETCSIAPINSRRLLTAQGRGKPKHADELNSRGGKGVRESDDY
ncbi:hypothetical protein BC826DRAFT_973819 [Russula brevipes]|nr:hypothetical protein BC826DRAFT_973819 [Russula brevipes]